MRQVMPTRTPNLTGMGLVPDSQKWVYFIRQMTGMVGIGLYSVALGPPALTLKVSFAAATSFIQLSIQLLVADFPKADRVSFESVSSSP